jgi:regulator of replication initiation timing
LDTETILKQFGDIEQKIETLLKNNKSLVAANVELKDKITQLEAELQAKTESENRNDEVKTLISTRIDSLMKRLDGITEAE